MLKAKKKRKMREIYKLYKQKRSQNNKPRLKPLAYYLFSLILIFSLTGCYDMAELEDRALVLAMGIDKGESTLADGQTNGFNILMEIPTSLEPEEDSISKVKAINAESVNKGMKRLDAYTGQELYYGHTKACVLGEEILKDKRLFKQAIDGLERNREISRKLIITASKTSSADIFSANNDSLTGSFINDFYKNNTQSLNTTFRLDLESLIKQLLASSNAVIPTIQGDKDGIKIGNLAIIKDYRLIGYLNEEESQGYMLLSDYKLGGALTLPFENSNLAFKITDKNSSLKIYKNNATGFKIKFDIEIEGNIEEYSLNKNIFVDSDKYKIIENECSLLIKNRAENVFNLLQKEYKADVFSFGEKIRKDFYADYIKMNTNTQTAFENAEVEINVRVKVKSAGTVK